MRDRPDSANQDVQPKLSLADFITENGKLITALGVFIALAVFSQGLQIARAGLWLSFLFVSLAVLVFMELSERLPSPNHCAWRLLWFRVIALSALLALIVYWLVQFRETWDEVMFVPVLAAVLWLTFAIQDKLGIYEKLDRQWSRGSPLNTLLRYGLVMLTLAGAGAVAVFSAPLISRLLEKLALWFASSATP